MKVSVIAYRDYLAGGEKDSNQYEVFKFSSDVDKCYRFISQLNATGGYDGPEDVVGGFKLALE